MNMIPYKFDRYSGEWTFYDKNVGIVEEDRDDTFGNGFFRSAVKKVVRIATSKATKKLDKEAIHGPVKSSAESLGKEMRGIVRDKVNRGKSENSNKDDTLKARMEIVNMLRGRESHNQKQPNKQPLVDNDREYVRSIVSDILNH